MADNSSDVAEAFNNEMRSAVLPVTIFVGLEAVFGFFGNLIVLYVFLFRYHVCNFRYFVLSLALIDITSSVTTIPGEMVTQLYWYIYPEPMICKVKSFFNMFTVCAEGLCLLTIAVDRYRKVCRPLGWQIKHRAALLLCCVIFAVAFILAIPVPFLWGTHTSQTMFQDTNITVTLCEIDQKYVNTSSPFAYSISTQIIIFSCLVVMLFLYINLARTLFKNRYRSQDKASRTNDVTPLSSSKEKDVENKREKGELVDIESASDTDTNTIFSDNVSPVVNVCQGEDSSFNDNKTTSSVPQSGKLGMNLKATEDCSPSNEIRTLQTNTLLDTRVRRKTLLIFILTMVFIVTTILYFSLLSVIADGALQKMTNSGKAVYFFFFRLYFINHVINPVVYGFMDPQFRKAIQNIKQAISISHITSTSQTE